MQKRKTALIINLREQLENIIHDAILAAFSETEKLWDNDHNRDVLRRALNHVYGISNGFPDELYRPWAVSKADLKPVSFADAWQQLDKTQAEVMRSEHHKMDWENKIEAYIIWLRPGSSMEQVFEYLEEHRKEREAAMRKHLQYRIESVEGEELEELCIVVEEKLEDSEYW